MGLIAVIRYLHEMFINIKIENHREKSKYPSTWYQTKAEKCRKKNCSVWEATSTFLNNCHLGTVSNRWHKIKKHDNHIPRYSNILWVFIYSLAWFCNWPPRTKLSARTAESGRTKKISRLLYLPFRKSLLSVCFTSNHCPLSIGGLFLQISCCSLDNQTHFPIF